MLRAFIRGSLFLLIATSIAIGASLLLGRATPAGDQFMYAKLYQPHWQEMIQSAPQLLADVLAPMLTTSAEVDQWSTVGLVAMDRRLTAVRHLRGDVLMTTWRPDGNSAIVTVLQDIRRHTYWMRWGGVAPALVDLGIDQHELFSPDGKWVVMLNRGAVGGINDIVSFDELLTASESNTSVPTPTALTTAITWTADSRTVFELPTKGSDDHTIRVYRLDDATQSFTEHEYSFDTTSFYAVSPDASRMVYLRRAERVLPSFEPLDYVDHYETRLLDLKTGEDQVIAERPSTLQLWSPSSRYLLIFPFETKNTTLPASGIPDWRVFYHEPTGQLIPRAWGAFMQSNPLNKPADSTNHPEKQVYVYDVLTGERQLIATREQFGEGYIIIWTNETDIIQLQPRVDYYVAYGRPGGELKRLQYEGQDLLVSLARRISQTIGYSASNRGGMSQPFYYVDFEHDIVTPLELGEHLMLNGSLGNYDQTSFLTFAADDRTFGGGLSTQMLLYQVAASGAQLVADLPMQNSAYPIYTRLEDGRFAIEFYDFTANPGENSRLHVWWFENIETLPQLMEVVNSSSSRAAWRPAVDQQE